MDMVEFLNRAARGVEWDKSDADFLRARVLYVEAKAQGLIEGSEYVSRESAEPEILSFSAKRLTSLGKHVAQGG
jgi:hypothetical protein